MYHLRIYQSSLAKSISQTKTVPTSAFFGYPLFHLALIPFLRKLIRGARNALVYSFFHSRYFRLLNLSPLQQVVMFRLRRNSECPTMDWRTRNVERVVRVLWHPFPHSCGISAFHLTAFEYLQAHSCGISDFQLTASEHPFRTNFPLIAPDNNKVARNKPSLYHLPSNNASPLHLHASYSLHNISIDTRFSAPANLPHRHASASPSL